MKKRYRLRGFAEGFPGPRVFCFAACSASCEVPGAEHAAGSSPFHVRCEEARVHRILECLKPRTTERSRRDYLIDKDLLRRMEEVDEAVTGLSGSARPIRRYPADCR